MPEQISLPGFDPPPVKKPLIDQIFFAIRPDEETAARIAEIVQRLCREHGASRFRQSAFTSLCAASVTTMVRRKTSS